MPAQPARRTLTTLATTAALCMGLLGWAGPASSQSLRELYEAARAFDATYLAARALAESAEFRAEQVESLARPSAALAAGASTAQSNLPVLGNVSSTSVQAALNGRYPLFNKANRVTIDQARRSLDSAKAELDIAEQDLIVRVAQAYFDVLGAQDTLATTQASKKAVSEQLASAKRNFEVGTATITDTREAQARFDLG
ncbi:MAG: TolC family protein, partial [Chitinophagaceae bacterium]|nr:TolC family protein [Rubrivivax sp.]